MGLIDGDELTTMTDAHRRVLRIVENLGYQVMDEQPFPPFQVDIYVPRAHAAIEVDGPKHNSVKDAKRDQILSDRYLLPVLRIPSDAAVSYIERHVREFLDYHALTAEIRFDQARDEMPWL